MPAIKKLTDAGAEVRFGNQAKLIWSEIQKYHMIIVLFDQVGATPETFKSDGEVLQKFVQAGGGVFFFWNSLATKANINLCLAPFGASLLKEFIEDSPNTAVSPFGVYQLSYAYTANISAGHPVTDGIKGLWYNVDQTSTCLFGTTAIDVSKDWRVLVAGEASATTYQLIGQHVQGEEVNSAQMPPGKYQSAPPIIAAREYGLGAVVFAGVNPIEAFYGQGLENYGDVMIANGDRFRRSDYGRLYDNALNWLSQHGKKSETLGKVALSPEVNRWVEDGKRTFDWSDLGLLADQQCSKPIKGVIGLHSTLSDGKDTPEALIAKAKASGLQWVAFTENLEALSSDPWEKRNLQVKEMVTSSASERHEAVSPAKWEQLRKICKDASTDAFAAMPGLDYADNTGDRWVIFGDFEWPDKKFFSPDKRKIINPGWWFATRMSPNGPYNAGKNKLHPWDVSLHNMWPIRTTIAGRRTDEAIPAFMHQQGIQNDPFPMAVDMVYNGQELADAAANRMCNYVMIDKPGDLSKFLREHCYFASYLGFASEGPLITDWRCVNGTRSTGSRWHSASTEQYRLKLSVESAVPIKDIKIYDGPWLIRRFCLNQSRVTVTVDLPHDKQRNLFAVITDADGKQAFTGGHFIRDMLNYRFMCSDRGNSICDAVITDEGGPYLTGPTAPYQRTMELFGLFPGYGERPFVISPPAFDGGMRPIGMQVLPSLFHQLALDPQKPDLKPKMETRMEIPVCSRDGILQENTSTGIVPVETSAWTPKTAPWDLKDVDINVRFLNVTPRNGDMGVILLEGRIGFKNAVKLQELITIFSSKFSGTPGNGDHFAISTPSQNVAKLNQSLPFSTEAPMAAGSYVMIFPSPLGSTGAMALEGGCIARVSASAPNVRVDVRLDSARDMKAGDELKYRLLLIRGRSGEKSAPADWESFALKFGLRGEPAYQVTEIKAGRVQGTSFLLELEPEDWGFSGTISECDLPIRLPIRMANMNQNWTFTWFDFDRKEWFPSAVDQVINQGYFTLDTRLGNHRIFAGHPVVSDNKELRILAFSDGKTGIQASVNNVGDAAADATVRLNPALGKAAPLSVHLEPGEVKNLEFPFSP